MKLIDEKGRLVCTCLVCIIVACIIGLEYSAVTV